MEAPGRRVENAEKRGAGKKSVTNTVHGAHEKFPDPRPTQQSSRKLAVEDSYILHGNSDRTGLSLNRKGFVNPICTSELGEDATVDLDLGSEESGSRIMLKGGNCKGTTGGFGIPSTDARPEATSDGNPDLRKKENVAEGTRNQLCDVGRLPQRGVSRERSRRSEVRKQMENGRIEGWTAKGVRNTVQPGRTFASLLNANPIGKKMKMDYVEPVVEGEQLVFVPQDEVILQAKKKWENYIVGYFISGSLALSSVERAARAYWGKFGLGRILADASGFYFFEIPDANERMKILEEGPWLFYGRGMVLQQWTPELALCKQTHNKIPLWARFHKVPLTLWTDAGLSGIASLVGKPLYADSYTDSMKKIDFARICIEVDANKPLPDTVVVHLAGEVLHIPVDYQWKPTRCPKCEVFGHVCKIDLVDVELAAGTGQMQEMTLQRAVDKEGFIPVQNRKNSNRRAGNSEGNHWVPEEENKTKGKASILVDERANEESLPPNILKQQYHKSRMETTAPSLVSSSSSSPYSSEGSESEEELFKEAISNAADGIGKQMSSIGNDREKEKDLESQKKAEKWQATEANGEVALSQVVAAIPNEQFQQKLTTKTKKTSGKSRSAKSRRR